MTELRALQGYPACGKTTRAKEIIASGPKWARVSRDDLRAMLFNRHGILEFWQEEVITKVERAQVEALLRAGVSVVVDSCNLRLKYLKAWAALAERLGVGFEVESIKTPAEECIQRDHDRKYAPGEGRSVGREVITELARKFPIKQWQTVVVPEKRAPAGPPRYDPTAIDAYIVDLDGTLALMCDRGPYEWHKVGRDEPNWPVINTVYNLTDPEPRDNIDDRINPRLIIMSGRDASCRSESMEWLAKHTLRPDMILMRPEGDNRKDSVVKEELYHQYIEGYFNVLGVFDDRQQVVDMWRSLGLPCFQVAPGDF